MAYRSRKIDWNLLLRPTMAGLETEARGSENFARGVQGGLLSIGQGLVRSRQEKESRRRADVDDARQDRAGERADLAVLLQYDAAQDRKLDRQARDTAMLDDLELGTQAVTQEAVTTGQVSPPLQRGFTKLVDAVGGADAAARRIADRYTRRGST